MYKIIGPVGVFIMCIQTTVYAGVVFHIETTFPNWTEMPSRTRSMMVEGNKLKMTMDTTGIKQSTVIYRGNREKILVINNKDHTWRAVA